MPLPTGYTFNKDWLANSRPHSFELTRDQIRADQDSFDPTADWDWKNENKLGPQGEALPELAIGWQPNGEADYGTGLAGWWRKVKSKVSEAYNYGYNEGVRISGIGEQIIEAKEVGKATTEEERKKLEAGVTSLVEQKQAERKPTSESSAKFAGIAEATKEGLNQAIWGVLDGLGVASVKTEQALGTIGYTLADIYEGKEVDLKKNWEASRLAYAAVFDYSVYTEMNRRLEAGERGDLAAQEVMIQNPDTLWPQLIGQVILDPLNVVTGFTKAGRALKVEKSIKDSFHVIENPALREFIENADMLKLEDAAGYGAMDELIKSQQALPALRAHADNILTAEGKLDELSKSYKMSSLTSSGKISHLTNETSEILMHVVNNAGPDEGLEILRGMVKSVSSDVDEAAEGISAMMRFADSPALFSEAGNDTTVMLSKMFERYGDDWLKNLDELRGDRVALTQDLLNKSQSVAEDMFPSVSKMLEAEKAVKAGGEVSEATRILAERAGQLPEYVKAATRFHDKAQTVVAPLNRFFAGVYMGWSPGYAFRNWSNNTLQILIDQGPGAMLGKADDLFADVEKLHGGTIQGAFGFGSKGLDVTEEAVKGATDVKGTLKAIKEGTGLKQGPSQILGAKFEENGAKRILAKTYRDTWNKGVTAMVKSMTPDLQAAGFSDDIIKRLPSYLAEHKGDARAVMDAIRTDSKAGVIDMFGDISRIDPGYKRSLEELGKWDEYANKVLHAATREDAQQAATKIFDEIAQAGDYVFRDGKAITTIDDKVLRSFGEGPNGLPQTRGIMISRRQAASKDTIEITQTLLNQSDNLVNQISAQTGEAIDVATLKKTRNISNFGERGSEAADEARRLNELANRIYKVDINNKNANLLEIWRSNPELFPTDPPAMLSRDYFTDALWTRYDELVSRTWGQGRDIAVDGVLGYFDDLKAAGVDIPDDWLKAINESRDYAVEIDSAKVGRFGEMVPDVFEPYGTRSSQIAQMAEQYGISTATQAGVPLDKKVIKTINKYAQVDYKSLEEIPLSVAEEAFKIKAGILEPIQIIEQTVTIADDAGSPWYYLAHNTKGINPKEFEEIMGGAFNVDKQGVMPGLFKNNGLGIDDIGRRLADGGFITADQAEDTQFVRDFLRNATKKTNTFTQEIRTGGQAGADIAEKAKKAAQPSLLHDPDLPYYDDAGNLVQPARKRILPAPDKEGIPTAARAVYEQMDDVTKMRRYVMDDIERNFGRKQVVNPVAENALRKAEKELTQKVAETRLISSRMAQEARDFTLLNYGEKSYWDVALAYIYPYHFWYWGTYTNWMKRIASNPSILAHYQRYKDNLATVHAGMPEWWKYNLNTNDLPGVDMENPLYFNLEATLWPLNGITGMDFNDPYKRVDWWTSTLDYMNKFGPSTWSPINIMTGLALQARGEQDAGERFMGRLFPQTATIKAVASKFGVGNLELDPLVRAFQGGLDPYERRRVERALTEMEQEAIRGELPYTREQIQDAAYSHEGEIWQEAIKRAVHGRSNTQISSFLFGVGFKGRTKEDMEIDKFYTDYNRIWQMKPNITPEEFKQGMSQLKHKYPFMDTLLLSRRDSVDRDAGLAYLVLQRIPPGSTSEYARAVDIDPALLDKFFADKGDIQNWSAGDRLKLMSGVMNLSAVLEIPNDMTRQEWTDAKIAYSNMIKDAESRFGSNINDLVDGYYAAKTVSYDKANDYLDKYPQVTEFMNWKAQRVIGSELLSAYYGGSSMIEGYYRSQMYADIEKELGAEIFDIIDEYNDIKTYGTPADKNKFYRQNKSVIKKYYDIKDAWNIRINQQVAELSALLPEGEGAGIRQDYDATSPTQQALVNTVRGEQPRNYQDFQQVIPERVLNLVQDYIFNGERLPGSAETQLRRIASDLGYYDEDELIQAIGASLYQAQAQP